jgi:hypothetical protein
VRIGLIILVFFTVRDEVFAREAIFVPYLRSRDVHAYVTGYNTLPEQTDDTPCVAASGANICGRTDVVACPRRINLGTYVVIRGVFYVCEDRLAKKYDSRFDISCDKNTDCPGLVTGWAEIVIFRQDLCRLLPTAAAPPLPTAPRWTATLWRPARLFAGYRRREWRRI